MTFDLNEKTACEQQAEGDAGYGKTAFPGYTHSDHVPQEPEGFELPPMDEMDAPHDAYGKNDRKENGGPSTVDIALEMLNPEVALFRDPDGDSYATIDHDGHQETHALLGSSFKAWTRARYYEARGKALRDADIKEVTGVLDSRAQFEKGTSEHRVYLRVANVGGHVFLDLGQKDWNIAKVSDNGWCIIPYTDCPVRFRRTPGMLPLPIPTVGGRISDLRRFLNTDDDGFMMLSGWVLSALWGVGPYPLLSVTGGQGSGKSTGCRVLRTIVDPATAPDGGVPRTEEDAILQCRNSHALVFDNVSNIKADTADLLCRISTGAGFRTRRFYSNSEEFSTYVQRPLILNGIPDLMNRGDLAERTLVVRLLPIEECKRIAEEDFWPEFRKAHAGILGAFLTVLSGVIQRWASTKADGLPRMADFAKLILAAEPGCPWPQGRFLEVFGSMQKAAAVDILDDDAVFQAIRTLAQRAGKAKGGVVFTGSPTEFLDSMKGAKPTDAEPAHWPRTSKGFANHLERIAPAMKASGWGVERSRIGGSGAKRICITYTPPFLKCEDHPSHPSHPSHSLFFNAKSVTDTKHDPSHPSHDPSHPSHDPSHVTDGSVTKLYPSRDPSHGNSLIYQANADIFSECDGCDGYTSTVHKWGALDLVPTGTDEIV
jgi:hypothetical protein